MAQNKPWLKKNEKNVVEVQGVKIYTKTLSFGDSRKAIKVAIEFDPTTKKANADATLLGVLRTIGQIEDWELTDENDKKLPITLDTFDNVLDEEFVGEIIQAVGGNESGVSEQEKK